MDDTHSIIEEALDSAGANGDEPLRQLLRNALPPLLTTLRRFAAAPPPSPPPRGSIAYDLHHRIPVFRYTR